MLKLEFQNMSGAQLRLELLELLGVSPSVANYAPIVAACQDNSEPESQDTDSTVTGETGEGSTELSTEPARTTRKRRTKAQIEADAAAEKSTVTATVDEVEEKEVEPEAEPLKEVEPPKVPDDAPKITAHILRAACIAAQDRLGAGEPVLAVLLEYKAKSVADLKEEDLRPVFDKVVKLGVEEKTSF